MAADECSTGTLGVVVVLRTAQALRDFVRSNFTLGGNVTAGPAKTIDVHVGLRPFQVYACAITGLFAGASVEGSIIMERKDANATAYRRPGISALQILSGQLALDRNNTQWTQSLLNFLHSLSPLPSTPVPAVSSAPQTQTPAHASQQQVCTQNLPDQVTKLPSPSLPPRPSSSRVASSSEMQQSDSPVPTDQKIPPSAATTSTSASATSPPHQNTSNSPTSAPNLTNSQTAPMRDDLNTPLEDNRDPPPAYAEML